MALLNSTMIACQRIPMPERCRIMSPIVKTMKESTTCESANAPTRRKLRLFER